MTASWPDRGHGSMPPIGGSTLAEPLYYRFADGQFRWDHLEQGP